MYPVMLQSVSESSFMSTCPYVWRDMFMYSLETSLMCVCVCAIIHSYVHVDLSICVASHIVKKRRCSVTVATLLRLCYQDDTHTYSGNKQQTKIVANARTGRPRPIGSLIFVGRFLQKSSNQWLFGEKWPATSATLYVSSPRRRHTYVQWQQFWVLLSVVNYSGVWVEGVYIMCISLLCMGISHEKGIHRYFI